MKLRLPLPHRPAPGPIVLLAILLSLNPAIHTAQADWVITRDGRAGVIDDRRDGKVIATLDDGSQVELAAADIREQLTDAMLTRQVDRLLVAVGREASRPAAARRLNILGAAAVPRLLVHLEHGDTLKRALALASLQYCWSPRARQPVIDAMTDHDDTVRRFARHVLRVHEGEDAVARATAGDIQSSDPAVAGPAIRAAERLGPDLQRMQRAAADPRLWIYITEALPRYRSPTLAEPVGRMLEARGPSVRAAAILALTHQLADDPTARSAVRNALGDDDALIRDLAAGYLHWHGQPDDIAALRARARRERDPYVLASILAAVDAIEQRSPADDVLAADAPDVTIESEADAAAKLRATPGNRALRRAAIDLLRQAQPYEPWHRYAGRAELPDAQTRARYEQQLEILALLFGPRANASDQRTGTAAAEARDSASDPPLATEAIAPVRDYVDRDRNSFGIHVEGDGPFADSHHVGDDVGWRRQGMSVVAIAPGRVRLAQTGVPSWGGLIVIEHRGPGDRWFCSLYAHLGEVLTVQPGQLVEQGQKIGVVGRDWTWANGGYRSHLHFGVHLGRFEQGRWITGYIKPATFAEGSHGWTDPQMFVARYPTRLVQSDDPPPADATDDVDSTSDGPNR